jgi:uncharacterized protein YvpB
VIWLVLVVIFLAVLGSTSLGLIAWQRTTRVHALEAELEAQREERQTLEQRLVAIQSTATAMESRLAILEASDPARQMAALQAELETADDSQELASFRESLVEMQGEVDGLQNMLDGLATKIRVLEGEDGGAGSMVLPPEVRLNVARQQQSHNLSCESSAASMVAQYLGVPLSEAEVLASLPFDDNPHLGFRGNVNGPTGGIEDYGVYAGPLMEILDRHGLQAWPVETGVEGIKAAVARGHPVIAWVTYDCMVSTPVEVTIGGQQVSLTPNQHVVVVTGYDAEGVWANDPWDGQEDYYFYADLQRAMGYFGDMAIEIAAR